MGAIEAGRTPLITGIGVVTPVGCDVDSFWAALLSGESGADLVGSFDVSELPNQRGCEVRGFSLPDDLVPGRGGRCTELAVGAAAQALASAGLSDLSGDGVTLVVGTTMGEVTQFEQDRALHPDEDPSVDDVRSLVHRPLDVMGRAVGETLGLGAGELVTVPAACAAGAYAVSFAARAVATGRARIALALGCEAFSRLAFVGFSRMRAMSDSVCRPFSNNRPGLLLGEGAGAIVIESRESASARGAEALASVKGFGLSCDAHHITGPHPEARGAIRAIRGALADGCVHEDAVDYVNAHGTGTPLNDKVESLAVRTVFSSRPRGVPVSSIKALTGHMLGAAGAVEIVASVLAMGKGVIPPTWNWVEADPSCDIDCVPNEPREAKLRHVISNSYAFGGNNASVLLGST